MAKKSGLGKGLSAILEDVEDAYKQDLDDNTSTTLVKDIPIEDITPNPYQPRKVFEEEALRDLSHSILKHGLLQPIVVVAKDDGYMLIAGERRLRASKLADLDSIKAIVADFEEENLRELALIENIQRENLNAIELANSYKELIEQYGITQEELSDIIHKSRTQITNTIRLLKLSTYTQNLLIDTKISAGHARVLIGLDEKKQQLIADTIVGQKLSVRDSEELVKNLKQSEEKEFNPVVPNVIKTDNTAIMIAVDKLLESNFKVKKSANKLIIDFSDESDVERFLSLLK
ncbi:MAG TPA: ParB/RepB/Spo0J family partition protein [Campylobacterales bacterium]|nr:ParB/RepB/Spo0J family partition protein [Campylobacterales bacterium]